MAILAVAVYLLAGTVHADDPPDLRATVRAAVEQLDKPSRAVRIEAEKTLRSLGPKILPLLPAPDLLSSVSARQAVRRIRVQLEHDAAESSIQASTVTLEGRFRLDTLVQTIEKQTDNAISLKELPEAERARVLPVRFSETRFWDAVERIESAGFRATFDSRTGNLTLKSTGDEKSTGDGASTDDENSTGDEADSLSTVTDRAFRIQAAPIASRSAGGEAEVLLASRLSVLCEPRLRPLFLRYQSGDFRLTPPGSSKAIPPFNSGASVEVPLGDGGREAEFSLSFVSSSASDAAARTARLEGKVNVLTAAREQPIAFRTLARSEGVARRRGGVTVTVKEVGFEGSQPESHNARVGVRVSYDLGANAFESHQTWVFHNRVYLVDPAGRHHEPNGGFSTLFQGDGSVGVEYRFKDLPSSAADWEFVYVAPTLLINVELPVDLRDIPVRRSSAPERKF